MTALWSISGEDKLHRRLLRYLSQIVLVGVVAFGGGELLARYVLGLGNPPLSVPHPNVEYMFAPNQDVERFGNRILINSFGMRSEELGPKLSHQLRILVLGDSVLNGGSLTDHKELATTILSDGNTLVLNASAGSWGPRNMYEYVRTFGLFESDAVVVVLSSHDAFDEPDFAPLDPLTHPTKRPFSALWEGLTRYAPRVLPSHSGPAQSDQLDSHPGELPSKALSELLAHIRAAKKPSCVVFHSERKELPPGVPMQGHDMLAHVIAMDDTKIVEDKDFIQRDDYRDNIHLAESGQANLAKAISQCLRLMHFTSFTLKP